jgi:hypothetical protein
LLPDALTAAQQLLAFGGVHVANVPGLGFTQVVSTADGDVRAAAGLSKAGACVSLRQLKAYSAIGLLVSFWINAHVSLQICSCPCTLTA